MRPVYAGKPKERDERHARRREPAGARALRPGRGRRCARAGWQGVAGDGAEGRRVGDPASPLTELDQARVRDGDTLAEEGLRCRVTDEPPRKTSLRGRL